jgi:hypothetical protein
MNGINRQKLILTDTNEAVQSDSDVIALKSHVTEV